MRRLAVVVFLLFCACRSSREPDLRRAFVLPEHVEAAIVAERELSANYEVEGDPWLRVLNGTARVVVTAGHATAQTREGSLKVADRGTGSLAQVLHQLTGVPVIYTTRRSPSDPNYYDDNAFKAAVAKMIEERKPILVLDLHASHSYRPYDVDFGTMNGRSLGARESWLPLFAGILREEGLMNLSQDYFAAARNQTVTKFASARGTPALQLEISSTWLDPGRDPLSAHRFAQLLQAIVRFIRSVDPTAQTSRPAT
jgi:hypothetical protein